MALHGIIKGTSAYKQHLEAEITRLQKEIRDTTSAKAQTKLLKKYQAAVAERDTYYDDEPNSNQ
jgi:hypothetical protein